MFYKKCRFFLFAMVCYDGEVALWSFITPASLISFLFLPNVVFDMVPKLWGAALWGPILYFILINIFVKFIFRGSDYQVAIRAAYLGCIFALGVYIWFLAAPNVCMFGTYMAVMSVFHFTEYMAIALSNPNTLSTDSFVINHSPQYTIAALLSWLEFALESYFFPAMKTFYSVSLIGLTLCVAGEFLRKAAMITARSNFNHLVQSVKAEGHVLVTSGVYSFCRHPSYVGWFYWAIGTQIILLNPICFIFYVLASWKFFQERVIVEEITLLNFFGQQYCDYQQKVPTGLPFIHGYKIEP